jgi:hypothetical protein
VRSGGDRSMRPVLLAALMLVALARGVAYAQDRAPRETTPSAEAASPGPDEIAKALAKVKADPNLATERTIKMLRWKDVTKPPEKKSGRPAWLDWVAGFFSWIGQSARVLLWCAAAVLAGLLVVYLVRIARAHGESTADEAFIVPTHVRDLDIRPETLPSDIGAAARQLWDRGDRRAALALLYRGLLSRLAHVHRVPIRDSSTEGDCLVLAALHLTTRPHEYASSLVRIWQRSVYGREDVQTDAVYVLCDDFASALDAPASTMTAATGGAA